MTDSPQEPTKSPPSSRNQLVLTVALALASVLLVGLGYFYISSLPRSEDHRVWTALHLKVKNGDRLEQVQSVLGIGKVVAGDEASAFTYSVLAFENPGSKVLFDDSILTYEVLDESGNKCTYFLHFRDSKLIHHDPAEYKEYNGINLLQ